MSLTCRANRRPMPSAELPGPAWIVATMRHVAGYEACAKPATHVGYLGTKPLCEEHAEDLRRALRSADSIGNLVAGRIRTEEEIAIMVRPLS